MIYLKLFWSFFQIGLFSIGGGYAAMPLIEHQVVELHSWLTMTQFADIMAIAGCVLPSCVIVMTLAWVYYRFRGLTIVQGILAGLRPAVVAMIASAGLSLMKLSFFGPQSPSGGGSGVDYVAVAIFAAGLLVLRKWKVSPIYVMGGAGLTGVLLYILL